MALPRIAYLMKAGRQERLNQAGPDEFLYGFERLRQLGADVELIEQHQLGMNAEDKNLFESIFNFSIQLLSGISGWTLLKLLSHRQMINRFDLIFVTTNSLGMALAVLRCLGLVKGRVLFLAMGLIESSTPIHWRLVSRCILRSVNVVTLSTPDAEALGRLLGHPVPYIPFGVDKNFWTPQTSSPTTEYVLSIGNDRHRDYPLLISAWLPTFPKLIIVTQLQVSPRAENIQVVKGSWHEQILSDEMMRELIRGAKFVVLPIQHVVQPSGQSSALQAMACGKAVLLTDYPGLWNRELMIDGQSCLLMGRPGVAEDARETIRIALNNPRMIDNIGGSARDVVLGALNSQAMAAGLFRQMEIALRRPLAERSVL